MRKPMLASKSRWTVSHAMRDYYEQGHDLRECEAHFGLSRGRAAIRIREAGGTTRRESGHGGCGPIPVIELDGEKVSARELGRRLGIRGDLLGEWAKKGYVTAHQTSDNRTYFLEHEVGDINVAAIRATIRANSGGTYNGPPKCLCCEIVLVNEPDQEGSHTQDPNVCDWCLENCKCVDGEWVWRHDRVAIGG